MGTIHHFSHEHALTAARSLPSRCSLCKNSKCTSKGGYVCHTCQHFIGSTCARFARQVSVPAHEHPLDLACAPRSENCMAFCNACGGRISGWRYGCSCDYDLHLECTLWPAKVTVKNHIHPLSLDFPTNTQLRGGNRPTCKQCGNADRLWGYGCTICGFFLHLGCAAADNFAEDEDTMDLLEQVLENAKDAIDVAVDIVNNISSQTVPPAAPQTSDDDCDCDDGGCDCCCLC
ncbi:unnamed protein product [Victoria cruziana]